MLCFLLEVLSGFSVQQKGKSKVLTMKGKMSCNNTDSRKDWLGRSSAKENLRILVNSKLKMIQMHALAAKSTPCLGALTGGIQALGQVKQLYCSTHHFGFGAVSTGRTEIS